MNQTINTAPVNSQRNWFRKIGGVATLIAGMLLLIAIISLLAPANGWLSPFQDVWLVLIFKLHAEFAGIGPDVLHGLHFLDILILALVGILCLSLNIIFEKAGKVWSLVAIALTLAGIVLYLITQIAGRSTVMLAVLIISLVMLSNKTFNKTTAWAGIFASVFLFTGDLTVGVHSNVITVLFEV